jgi:hypothetical protein
MKTNTVSVAGEAADQDLKQMKFNVMNQQMSIEVK